MRNLLRNAGVSTESKAVQPGTQPTIISVNCGFSTRVHLEEEPPAFDVSWPRREGKSPRAAIVSRLSVPALGLDELLPFCELP